MLILLKILTAVHTPPKAHRHHKPIFILILSLKTRISDRSLKEENQRKMKEGRGSSLVYLLVVVLCLVAFTFSIAAERRRSRVLSLSTSPLTFFI